MKLKEDTTKRRSDRSVRKGSDRVGARDLLELYLDEAGSFRVLKPEEQDAVLLDVVRKRHRWLAKFLDTEVVLDAVYADLQRVANGEVAAGVLIPGPPRPDRGSVEDYIGRLHAAMDRWVARCPKRPFKARRGDHRRLFVSTLLFFGFRPAILERYEMLAREANGAPMSRSLNAARNRFLEARRPLVEHNLRLVFKVARQFVPGPLSLVDLIQEGNLGLIRSTESFNPRFSVRFSTYAYLWIRQSIIRALENKSRTIRLPVSVTQRLRKLDFTQDLDVDSGNDAESRVHASILGNPAVSGVLSLNDRLEDGETALADLVPDPNYESPDQPVRVADLKKRVSECINCLSGREQLVVRLRFGINCRRPHTLAELGTMLAVSPERIRQIQMSAFKNLKAGPCGSLLEELSLD